MYGNIFIIFLLDILTFENIELFLSSLQYSLFDISMTEPGSRVIQKLIEKICNCPLLLNRFIFYFSYKNIGLLMISPYGNHIFQKYLSVIKNKDFTNFIYNYIFNDFINIIKEKHGVCVIKKSLLEADDEQRNAIYKYILNNLAIIMKDFYSNFIIQYIFIQFEKRKFDEILPILIKIEENIVDYCKNKNSSSVIEKCFEKGDPDVSVHIMKNILDYHSDSLADIIYNGNGFFVIKKSILIPNEYIKREIIKTIINKKNVLKESNNGRKIISIFYSKYKNIFDSFEKGNIINF
jgi:hypothetical protein